MDRYAEDREFGPPDNEPHNEGILLFSDSKECYGEDLSTILSNITSDISGYKETIVADPHGEGLDLLKDDPIGAETTLLKNSLWLIDHECITKDGLKDDFLRTIQAAPPKTQVCIWINAPESEHDIIENQLGRIMESKNVYLVKSKGVLEANIMMYLDLHANPKRGKEAVIDWNNKVCDLIDARS